jgi:hypothetical protein
MWFQMVHVPSLHPFHEEEHGKIWALWLGVRDWMFDAIQPAIVLLIALAVAFLVDRHPAQKHEHKGLDLPTRLELVGKQLADILKRRPWIILAVIGVVLFPSSILGYVKIGGDVNNFALSNYFLLLAGIAGLVDLFPQVSQAWPKIAQVLIILSCGLVVVLSLVLLGRPGNVPAKVDRILHPGANQQEMIYDFVKAHPGTVYFPWNNLAMLQAEGEMYHFEWGFVDRMETGKWPTNEQVSAHIPGQTSMIAYPPDSLSMNSMRFFVPASQRVQVVELPGYTVFRPPVKAAP